MFFLNAALTIPRDIRRIKNNELVEKSKRQIILKSIFIIFSIHGFYNEIISIL